MFQSVDYFMEEFKWDQYCTQNLKQDGGWRLNMQGN